MFFRISCIATLIFVFSTAAFSQALKMKAVIRDANTHQEIPDVNVYIPALDIGTITDAAGRFELLVMTPEPDMRVKFQHIGYDTLSLMIEEVLSQKVVSLQERLIPLPIVQVESFEAVFGLQQNQAATISIMDESHNHFQAFTDAGDLLNIRQNIQVDEAVTGKKAVSFRGGSPDEVAVLYNGVRLNSSLDNIYDVALIDLNEVERIEVIRGSQTSLYGPEAFSGIINVVPRMRKDYNIRLQQRIGTNDDGDFGAHLYKKLGSVHFGYSLQNGSNKQQYENEPEGRRLLHNENLNHTGSIDWHLKEDEAGRPKSSFGILFTRNTLDYQNERDSELLNTTGNMISARYKGTIGALEGFDISSAYQWLDESQFLHFANFETVSGFLSRDIEHYSWHLNADKLFHVWRFQLNMGYRFEQSELTFNDNRFTLSNSQTQEFAELSRQRHAFVSTAKMNIPIQSNLLQSANLLMSYRVDAIADKSGDVQVETPIDLNNSWQNQTAKITFSTAGQKETLAYGSFINVGLNQKFPTLLQQISTRQAFAAGTKITELKPEKNVNAELGIEIRREVRRNNFFGWQFNSSIFYNTYTDKIRSFSLPGTPIAFYDNVADANVGGVDAQYQIFMFRKKVTIEAGASTYFFSNKDAFPFRPDSKYTFDIRINENGYALRMHGYKEGQQIAQIRRLDGTFSKVDIPSIGNFDIYFGKNFLLGKTRLFFNASLRNLLNDDYQLDGLVLRDRRYYFTIGVRY